MRPHSVVFLAVLGLVALIAGATSLYPVLIKLAFDQFAGQASGDEGIIAAMSAALNAIFGDRATIIHAIAALVVIVTAIKGFALLGQTVLTNRVAARIEADMQSALFARMIDLDLRQASMESPAALT